MATTTTFPFSLFRQHISSISLFGLATTSSSLLHVPNCAPNKCIREGAASCGNAERHRVYVQRAARARCTEIEFQISISLSFRSFRFIRIASTTTPALHTSIGIATIAFSSRQRRNKIYLVRSERVLHQLVNWWKGKLFWEMLVPSSSSAS